VTRRRALLIVLDGVGAGAAPDAAAYGDEGTDTLGQVLRATPGLRLPTLESFGLARILGLPAAPEPPLAMHGRMRPAAPGKDSTTGPWEIAGAPPEQPFATFDRFPDALVAAIEAEAGVRLIGNRAASGTGILEELGAEHLRTGAPILYTSADSVLQIAAHEAAMPVPRLHALCALARRHADAWRIGRVIARPFRGGPGRGFERIAEGRHDYGMPPPTTVLDALGEAGWPVTGIGKVADLFGGRGFARSLPTASNAEGMRAIAATWAETREGLVFANLLDFDTVHGHRRDPDGFAAALAAFDAWAGGMLRGGAFGPADLAILTADHGNDPTFRGTDHTREEVPLLALHGDRRDALGARAGFADVAATLARFFGLPPWRCGRPFPA
jgi:phosphopentomutase